MVMPSGPDRHVLYRFFDADDQLLYVGMTMDPGTRWKAHGRNKSWWAEVKKITLEHFDSYEAVADAEIAAIDAENPLYNVVRTEYKPKTLKRVLVPGGSSWHVEEVWD